MINKKYSTFKNYLYTAFYQIVAIFVPLVTTPYLARVLGAEGIGQYGYSYSLLSFVRIFAVLGFNIYGQREIAKYKNDAHAKTVVFWEIMIAKSMPFFVSLIFYCLLTAKLLPDKYSILLWCFLPNLLSYLFDTTFFLQGEEAFKTISIRDFIVKMLGVACIFVFVKEQDDVWVYALSYGMTTFLSVASLLFYVRKRIVKISWNEIHPFRHFKHAIVLFVPTIAASTFSIIDKSMIQWIVKDDSEVGYYEETQKIISLLFGLVSAIGTVMCPKNTQIYSNGDLEKLKENINKSMSFAFLLAFPLCFGLIAVSSVFVPVFFGPGYDKVKILLCLAAPIVITMAITNSLGIQYLIPTENEWRYTLTILLSALINIILNIPLIYFFQSLGAIVGSFVSEAVSAFLLLFTCRKIISFKSIFSCAWKNFVSALIMFLIVYGTSLISSNSVLHLLLLVVEGVVLYFGINYILKDNNILTILNLIGSKLPRRNNK